MCVSDNDMVASYSPEGGRFPDNRETESLNSTKTVSDPCDHQYLTTATRPDTSQRRMTNPVEARPRTVTHNRCRLVPGGPRRVRFLEARFKKVWVSISLSGFVLIAQSERTCRTELRAGSAERVCCVLGKPSQARSSGRF